MKLWARNNKLYYGHNRIGQVIIHTFKQTEIPIYNKIDDILEGLKDEQTPDTDNTINNMFTSVLYKVNFLKLSEKLIIDNQKFKELLSKGDYTTLVTLPLYSKRYFPDWLLSDDLQPINFDFIQVEGKTLIYADGSNVKIIGQIDDETAYYLLYYGIIISDDQVIRGINYAVNNNLGLRSVGDKSFMVLTQLLKLMKTGFIKKIKSIIQKKGLFIIKTSEGVYYGTQTILTNDDSILNTKHPIKSGTIIRVVGDDYVALNYEIDESTSPLVFIEINKNSVPEEVTELIHQDLLHETNPLFYIKTNGKRIFLQGHLSILSSKIYLDKKTFKVTVPKSVKITSKPKLKKVNNKWIITYDVEYTFARTTTTYIDNIEALIDAHSMEHKTLEFEKLSKKMSSESYRKLINRLAEAELFASFNLVNNHDTYIWYKVNDISFQDGVIYIMGYGKLNINGIIITNDLGEDNLIIKTETGEYKVYKIVRVDNVFKRTITGENFIIKNEASKLTIPIARAVSQLLTLTTTLPLNFKIKINDETIKIVVNNRKIFTYPINDFNIYFTKNTFMVYSGKPPRGFILPVEHEIVKNFVSALFINFNNHTGYWFLGDKINDKKYSFINYRFFNGEKLNKPLFIKGEFEIAGIKIKPNHHHEMNTEFSVLISDLYGETVKIPIIKNRSLLSYV